MKEEVARQWNVGAVSAVTPLGGGSINGAYCVEAQAGRFHLRAYRKPERLKVEREHAAIALALDVGIPTPTPTCQGGGIGSVGERWAALFPVALGAPVPRAALTHGHAAALGAFLATLHLRLPHAVPFTVPAVGGAGIQHTVSRLERIKDVLTALPQPDEADGWALERTRQRLQHLRTSSLADHTPIFPRRFLHGDYHDANVFFVDGQPAAIIDWEQTRLAPRTWEIVRALHLSLGLGPQLCAAFLAGYRDVAPLPVTELEDGAKFYAHLQERDVWTYESVYLENNPGPKVFIRPPPYVPFDRAWREADLG